MMPVISAPVVKILLLDKHGFQTEKISGDSSIPLTFQSTSSPPYSYRETGQQSEKHFNDNGRIYGIDFSLFSALLLNFLLFAPLKGVLN
jgi:hypothetical protein